MEPSGDGDLYPYHENDYKGMITTYYHCQTEEATHLCIHSAAMKLSQESADNGFSIGGTYENEKEELWFYSNVSQCHGDTYLLNLFVVFRKIGKFSLTLPSDPHDLTERILLRNSTEKMYLIAGPTKQYRYTSSKADEVVFVKTFCFTKDDLLQLGSYPLLVPCSIVIHDSNSINQDILKRIKLEYTVKINEALYKARENEGDFNIQSATCKKYPIHLFVAAAHSQSLREIITKNNKICYLNMNDEDVEMLVGFLYKGSVDNFDLEKVPKVLELADMLMMPGMFKLAEKVLAVSLNVDNAVDTAILAKKYNLPKLLEKVFHFIKHHPELLSSSGIQDLNDIALMKSMLQHLGKPCHCTERRANSPLQ